MATPVEVWAPAFRWLPELTVDAVIARFVDDAWCRLCEQLLPYDGKLDEHVQAHVREWREWEGRQRRARERENRSRLKRINRERQLERELLDGGEAA